MGHWEDRVTKQQYDKIEAAIKKFRAKKSKTRRDEHVLYDDLTNNGMNSEEADEYINLLLEDN